MVTKPMKVSQDQEFIDSKRWKCIKSPSGAHHWMIRCGQMTCKHCGENRSLGSENPIWSNSRPK